MDKAMYAIKVTWDDEARVWIATSPDLPGLVLESGSVDALIERVKIAVPELLEIEKARCEGVSLGFNVTRQLVVA
jgi:hypothetical protein